MVALLKQLTCCEEVGRAAGENMRISNYEGGSKREFFSWHTQDV